MEQRRISHRDRGAGKIVDSIKRPGTYGLRAFLLSLVALVQVLLLSLCPLLRWLCDERAGVMKHVYYRSVQLSYGIMSDWNLTVLSIAAWISAVVLIGLFFLKMGKWRRGYLIQVLWAGCLSLFLASASGMSWSVDHVAYRYVVMASSFAWALQILPLSICRRS